MIIRLVLTFVFILYVPSIMALDICPKDRPDYFCKSFEMVPNSPVQLFDFYVIPSKIIGLFNQELQKAPAPIILDARWESPYFGAGVSLYDNQIKLMVLGGTVRVDGVSKEAYAAIICHELGHIIGGYPFQTISGSEWTSSEGQADYFAARVCLPKYFSSLGVHASEISEAVETAGFEMMWAFRNFDSSHGPNTLLRKKVELPSVSSTLINQYPTLQCRYENFRNINERPSCWFKK